MNKYGLHGHLKAKEGKADELAAILLQASELVSQAKGCRIYTISLDATQPNTVWITEVWDSKEDHGRSLQDPRVRELIGAAMPLLDGSPSMGQQLEVLGGVGV